jgi:hypothetical protein
LLRRASRAPGWEYGSDRAPNKLDKAEPMKKVAREQEAKQIDPKLVPLVQAFAKDPRVTHGGKGFGSGALKVNGKIFALISSQGLFVVKLPKDRVTELVSLGRGEYFDPGRGKLMKEWFATHEKPKTWLALAKEAHRFVAGDAS